MAVSAAIANGGWLVTPICVEVQKKKKKKKKNASRENLGLQALHLEGAATKPGRWSQRQPPPCLKSPACRRWQGKNGTAEDPPRRTILVRRLMRPADKPIG